jgi:hypothetical protein
MIRISSALLLIAFPAFGQSTCADREGVAKALAETYHESQRMVAINGASVLEFWGNEDASTWTLIVTYPDGLACVLGAGEGFAIAVAGPGGDAL